MDHLWHWWDMNQQQVDGYFDSLFVREGGFDEVEKKVNAQLNLIMSIHLGLQIQP